MMRKVAYDIIEDVMREMNEEAEVHNINRKVLSGLKEDWFQSFEGLQQAIMENRDEEEEALRREEEEENLRREEEEENLRRGVGRVGEEDEGEYNTITPPLSIINNSSASINNDNQLYGDDFPERREPMEFSDEIDYSEDIEDLDIKKAEETQYSYLLCLYVKVTKVKGKFKCVFREGFANPGGIYDLPFNSGSGDLEWDNRK